MIGAIADDFTGATDIAAAFRRAGLRVVLSFVVDDAPAPSDADVLVVAVKTRTIEPSRAVAQSVRALRWLREAGADQFFFKYCSTFDSRDEGNIGPVADALLRELQASHAVVVPSSPTHRRTQYLGYLFVGDALLSQSPMRDHPLTPMTDALIPRVLARQTSHRVGLIDLSTVRRGTEDISAAIAANTRDGVSYSVIDATEDSDLATIGEAVVDDRLITGAAGLAGALGAASVRARGIPTADQPAESDQIGTGRAAALAGSCSSRTLEQVEYLRARQPSFFLDAVAQPDPHRLAEEALQWYDTRPPESTPLLFSSQPPEDLHRSQELLGAARASQILETATGLIARGLLERGVRTLVVAGGETSGAVVTALGVNSGEIGLEAAPGVPWIYTHAPDPSALLLKSGNFGDPQMLDRVLHPEGS